jgi:conjugal transfer mating pair stabilization protein TraN
MYADGAAAGYNSDAYRTANSTTRPTVDVTRADLSSANTVTDDPNAYLQGVSADGSTGNCVPLPPSPGTTNTAEWTCNVGSSVVEQPKTCTRSLTVAAWNETLYQYLCVTAPGFPGCAALEGNALCRKTGTFPVPDYNLTVDYYDCDASVSDPNVYLLGTVAKSPPADAFQVVSNVYRCNSEGITDALTFDPVTGFPVQYVSGLQQCGTIASEPTCTRTTAAAAGLADRQLCKTWDFIGDPFGGGGYLYCLEPAAPEEVYSCSANVAGIVPESSVSKWFTQIWTDNACSVDLGTCTLASETCTAPNETRLIDGVPVTRPAGRRRRPTSARPWLAAATTAASSMRRPAAPSTTRPASTIRRAAMAPARLPSASTSARSRARRRSQRSTSAAATSTASTATASRSSARPPTSSRTRSWR